MAKKYPSISTVNVLEIIEGTPSQIIAYPETVEGNFLAEKAFRASAKANGAKRKDMRSYVEDGSYENSGTYGIHLIHSN